MTLALAFVASTRPWQQRWNRHLHSYATGERLVAIIADPRDLLDEDWQVLLIDAASSWLTPEFVATIHRAGRGIVAVVEPTNARLRAKALTAEVDAPLEVDATPAELITTVHAVAASRPFRPRVPPATARRRGPGVTPAAAAHITAVGGPPGSRPERVAVALAAVMAGHRRVALIDVNEVDPCLAPRLGLHPQPNIVDAIGRVSASREELLLHPVEAGFWALPGLAAPAQWKGLGPVAVRRLLAQLSRDFDHVVAITGPIVEDAARFALSTTTLAAAGSVVAVGEASLVGLPALYEWVAGAAQVAPAPIRPVATYLRLGRDARADVADQLTKLVELLDGLAPRPGRGEMLMIPGPDRAEERGRWDGRLYRRSALMRPISKLAKELMP